ncbi:MAG TPA: DinB family protein, partial [Ignavibacteria bacterium]|nr:DinB family protein [Ignavibacteria bacterium]
RLNTKANHPAWLAGSMVEGRFEMAKELGADKDIKQEAFKLFENHQGIKDETEYPSMDSYLHDWKRISPLLRKLYVDMTDEKLDSQF